MRVFFKIHYEPLRFFSGEGCGREEASLHFNGRETNSFTELYRGWYVDGTFEIIAKPFTQLFSMDGFIRKEQNLKQILLCFVLMSGWTERVYSEVLGKKV
jgi:hypothetical protein